MTAEYTDPMARLIYKHEDILEFVDTYETILSLKYSEDKWRNIEVIP